MIERLPEKEIKHDNGQECACGCSAAYDQIDDTQFEKAFNLNILSKKHIIAAVIILLALAAAVYFII